MASYEERLNALLDRLIAVLADASELEPNPGDDELLEEVDASVDEGHGIDSLIERIVGRLKEKHVKTHEAADDE